MLGRRDAESLSKREEPDFEVPSPDLSQISDLSPDIGLDTYAGLSGWQTPESVSENQEQHLCAISQQKESFTGRESPSLENQYNSLYVVETRVSRYTGIYIREKGCKGEVEMSEEEYEISRRLSFVFDHDSWMDKQSTKIEESPKEEVKKVSDILHAASSPHHFQRREDEADGATFRISSSTSDLQGLNEEPAETEAGFARKTAPEKLFVCDSDIQTDEGLIGTEHPSDTKPHRQEDNLRQNLHSQSPLTDVEYAECLAESSDVMTSPHKATSTEKPNLRSQVTQECADQESTTIYPTSDSLYAGAASSVESYTAWLQPQPAEYNRTGPTVEQGDEDRRLAIAFPGQCKVHSVHIQIFHDEETLCLECVLWVKQIELSDFKDYKKRPIKPMIIRICDTDTLHFRFATRTGHDYSIDQESEQILHGSQFRNSSYETFPYRIDPDPDDIKGNFVDINYFIRVNSGIERKIPIRIKVVRKKGSESIENPTMQFHAHNHCGNRSTVARTIAKDNAHVEEKNTDCKSFFDGNQA